MGNEERKTESTCTTLGGHLLPHKLPSKVLVLVYKVEYAPFNAQQNNLYTHSSMNTIVLRGLDK